MLRGAVPALSPLASHNKGGGREAGAAGPGGGWMAEPDTAAHGRASAKGARGRRCRPAMAARPASRPCLAGGSRAQRPPARSHADPPQGSGDRRGGGGGRGGDGGCGCPPGHPKESGRKEGAGSITPSTTVLSPCCDPGMLCPAHSKTPQPLKSLRLKGTGSSQPCSRWFWEPGPAGAGSSPAPHSWGWRSRTRAGRG